MTAHLIQEEKICSMCNKMFECKQDDIKNCQCYGVPVDEPSLSFIKDKYGECLCKACLISVVSGCLSDPILKNGTL